MNTNLTRAEAVASGKPIALPQTEYFYADFFSGAEWIGERPKDVVFLGRNHVALQRSTRPLAEGEEPIAYVHYGYNKLERCFKPVYGRHPDELDPTCLSRSETTMYVRVLIAAGRTIGETESERRVRRLREDLSFAQRELNQILRDSDELPKHWAYLNQRNDMAERINRRRILRDELRADLALAEQELIKEAESCPRPTETK
ncbi:hypothetical protein [Saccharibacillus brassicae]|uniref:Uncharacterized protein n=1 Tax=Saccharibacillus brassicae TaxID=2583377 RepID=A0A4Y6V4D0_SACBS|nr:hypothetical protein [Saccharibacillus brassicae]QDH23491.1 hypothetical protein FFV09_23065 [Saccharibacillus brassicae]